MEFHEPKIEYIELDTSDILTVSRCSDEAQKAAMTVCDCTDDVEGQLPGCVGDIV